jgi:hypothetical protein
MVFNVIGMVRWLTASALRRILSARIYLDVFK